MPLISEFPIAGPQGKQGPIGPQGKQGPEGKRGPMGPAGPGTGDMLAMVYDPQGKAIDVYKYTDDAAAGRADLTLSNLSNRQKALRNIGGAPRRNLLDNWFFVGGGSQQGGGQFPINQRGQTSYSGNQIPLFDRWKINISATVTISQSEITISNNGAIYGGLWQASEIFTVSGGEQYTFSVLLPESTPAGWYIDLQILKQSDNTPVASATTIQDTDGMPAGITEATLTIPDGVNEVVYYYAFICNNTNISSQMKLKAAKLEFGHTQTLAYQDEEGNWQLFETPDYEEELAKCQRYLVVYTVNKQRFCGVGHLDSASAVQSVIWTPVPMRIAPTISGDISIYGGNNNLSGTNLTGAAIGPTGIRVNFKVSNAVNHPAIVMIHTKNSLLLSAEL